MSAIYRFLAETVLDPISHTQYQYISEMKNVTLLHDHDFTEIFLVACGQVEHVCNGQTSRLRPGDMILIRPADRHCYHPVQGDACALFNLAFSVELMRKAIEYLTDSRNTELMQAETPPTVHLAPTQLQEWASRFRALAMRPLMQKEELDTRARMLLIRLLATFFLAQPIPAGHRNVPLWLTTLRQAMCKPENFCEGVQAMCRLCPCSKEHLYRTFRRFYSETPGEYVRQLQMSFAANLLAHTTLSITQIALEAGCENLGYFYLCFKRMFDTTPQAYRRMVRRGAV